MIGRIETRRLHLEPYFAADVMLAHVAWLNDPEVVRYSEQRHKHHTLESVREYVNDMATNPDSHLWGITAVIISDDDMEACNTIKPTLIGTISAHVDPNNMVADVGILIGERFFWGYGMGLEAWNGVCNHLFANGIRRVECGCHYENRAMRRVAEKSGMALEGVRHDHFVVDGHPQHLLMYGKTKPESARVTVDDTVHWNDLRGT